ncbi:Uncharacterized protein PBTT_02480 [Plasmodiophora brassicae]
MVATMTQQLVADANNHHALRGSLASLREWAKPIVDPVVDKVDMHVSDLICSLAAKAEPRTLKYDDVASPSSKKLLSDATSGKFVTERMKEAAAVSAKASNAIESNVGQLGRIAIHTFVDANSFWATPIWDALNGITAPIVQKLDSSILAVVSKAVQHVDDGEPIPKAVVDLITVDALAYASVVLRRARQFAITAKDSDQIHKAIDAATEKLKFMKNKLDPAAKALLHRVQQVSDMSDQSRFPSKARAFTEALWKKTLAAYGKSKDLTDSTLVYLDSQDVLLIPGDVYDFFRKVFGIAERDEQYEELLKQFKDLFESLTNVFSLTQSQQSESPVAA